jgi:hypothetical protein
MGRKKQLTLFPQSDNCRLITIYCAILLSETPYSNCADGSDGHNDSERDGLW